MAKRKPGLHKKVSSIFDGSQIPKAGSDISGSPPGQHGGQRQPPGSASPAGTDKLGGRIVEKPVSQKKTIPQREKKEFKLSAPIQGVNDAKTKIKLALIPVLIIILILVLRSTLSTKPAGEKSSAEQSRLSETAQTGDKTSGSDIDWQIPKTYPSSLPDPMVSGRKKYHPDDDSGSQLVDELSGEERDDFEGDENEFEVKSILYSEFSGSVVIGEQILYEGDMVSGAVIKKINKDSVEFEKNGKKFTVPLHR